MRCYRASVDDSLILLSAMTVACHVSRRRMARGLLFTRGFVLHHCNCGNLSEVPGQRHRMNCRTSCQSIFIKKRWFRCVSTSVRYGKHHRESNRPRTIWLQSTFQIRGRQQRRICTRYRSRCVGTFTTCKRMLILSKRCERTFGFGRRMQRLEKS